MDLIRLHARLESLADFRDFVFQKLSAQGVAGPAFFSKIELILEEVLTNVFNYAYPAGPGEAELACELKGGMLMLSITDWGSPFNPLDSPPPDLSQDIDERAVGGLGIYFVKEMVDEISYERRDSRNILTLSIKITA
jgi:anti-sigma regulatory factor (Ser/Thr protein kinase)